MARRFSRRRGFRRRIQTMWTGNGQIAEATRAAGAQDNLILVAPSDYAAGQIADNTEAGNVTLLRIRGSLDLRATVIGGLALCAIYRTG